MDLLQNLLALNSNIKSIDQQPICDSEGRIVGWNCYFMNQQDQAIAGGTASHIDLAKRIAVAECYERALFKRLISNPDACIELLLNESPSTSGFAAGFERKGAGFRSICEAVERWAWSKWIDEGYVMPKVTASMLSPLSIFLQSFFESTAFFQVPLKVGVPFPIQELTFSVFLGFKGDGVFAGSRVTGKSDDCWQHAIIESYRNLKNFGISDRKKIDSENLIGRRAYYFGSHANEALMQISRANKDLWPVATLRLHKEIPTGLDGVYLYRSMCNDFQHWHLGDEKRFVY